MKKMLKKIFSYYRFSTLKYKISRMGFSITPAYLAAHTIAAAVISLLASAVFKLKPQYCLFIVLVFIMTVPIMLVYRFKSNYEKNRFNDIVDYMQRLIYAYQKSGKIYTALLDVREVVTKPIRHEVNLMLKFIDEGKAEENLYKEAFAIIESHYKCTRLATLHAYLIDAETNGGEGAKTLALLLQDIREWALRTREYKTERASIKTKVLISIGLSVATLTASLYMVPSEYTSKMMLTALYQVGTSAVLIMYILLYAYVSKSLSVSYLDAELDDLDVYLRAVNRVDKFDIKTVIKKGILLSVIAAGSCVLVYILNYSILMIPIIGVFALAVYQPVFTNKSDKKRIVKEINKAFPAWIRNLVLLLQTNNVGRSIQKSLVTCNPIMRPHVEKLLAEIDENPDSDEPFVNFCCEYDLPEIKTTMSFLYYLSNFGSEEMLGQLDYIIEQNTYLSISEEKLRNSDSLSMMNALVLAPMVISMGKLMLDMYCLYDVFSNIMMDNGF